MNADAHARLLAAAGVAMSLPRAVRQRDTCPVVDLFGERARSTCECVCDLVRGYRLVRRESLFAVSEKFVPMSLGALVFRAQAKSSKVGNFLAM